MAKLYTHKKKQNDKLKSSHEDLNLVASSIKTIKYGFYFCFTLFE